MNTYNFKKLTNSSVLVKNNNTTLVLTGSYTAQYKDKSFNDILVIKHKFTDETVESINVAMDDIFIDDVGKTYTEAEELYLELDALGIFFLDESGDGGGGGDVMTKTEFNEIANTYAAFGYTQKTSVSGLPIVITGVVGIGSNNLTPPNSPQPVTGGDYNGYVKIDGFVEIAASETLTVSNSEIVIGQDGNYFSSHAWIDISSSINTNTLGLVFCIQRGSQLLFSSRPVGTRGFNGNNRTNLSGGGFLDNLEDGDKISVWIGSEDDADLSIYDCNVGINLRSKN
jgi:hypothetical protein